MGKGFPKSVWTLDPKNARTLVDIQHLNEYQNRTPSGTQRVNKTNVYKCGMPGTCGSLPGAKTQRGRDCLHEKGVTDRLAMLDYINLLLCTHCHYLKHMNLNMPQTHAGTTRLKRA